LPAVKLLLRCDYTDLLDATRTPADLLTRLVGGSLRLTTAAARRLLDHRGAELRTIIVDHGHILGVGRWRRTPRVGRAWTHPRTGLQITSLPTTWRPPPTGPP
jgi:hypothetical protein